MKLGAVIVICSSLLTIQALAAADPVDPSSHSLTIDVYTGVISSSEIGLKQLWMMVQDLQKGGSATLLPDVIHIQKKLQESFDLAKEAKDADGQEIDLAAHVESDQASDNVKIVFSKLGRPPAYEGATTLSVGPNEHRVLRLPAVQAADGEQRETIVVISTAPQKTDSDGHSRFEVERN
jgi:hypothetical protein